MPWGVQLDVPLPVEVHDAVHSEVLEKAGGAIAGLLVHVARPTPEGFTVIEVWRSRVDFDHDDATLIGPIMTRLSGGAKPAVDVPPPREFGVRGLVIPQGGVVQ